MRPGTATWLIEPDPNDPSRHRLLVTIQNGYPNFSLYCEVHFANDGTVPIEITNVHTFNPNPSNLTITAVEAEPNKIMQPCGFTPDWYEGRKGTETRDVPANCRQEIQFRITVKGAIVGAPVIEFVVEVQQVN